jgi:hypothetical protein
MLFDKQCTSSLKASELFCVQVLDSSVFHGHGCLFFYVPFNFEWYK